ncbi:hypothetical protein SDC9_94323 [bioreactor metagenome]|uniref:Uncharacterized protein n=1 Tax=bioreactor metagenome TaxID=1076179 RepID=A0A645A3I9_9ZZZZ
MELEVARTVKVTLTIDVAYISGGDQITDDSIKKLFEDEVKHVIAGETYRQLEVKAIEIAEG